MGVSGRPRYHITLLSLPRQSVMVRFSDTASGVSATGMITGSVLGLLKVVVSIKKVMSKNARSTIAVRSTRGGGILLRVFLPVFGAAAFISAMTLRFKVK